MINALAAPPTIEEFIDAIAEIVIGPEFRTALSKVHERARRKIPIRFPNADHVYTEDVEQPHGYPACEVLAITTTRGEDGNGVNSLVHEISLQWTVNGDNEQVMGREVKRLIEATSDVFNDGISAPVLGGKITLGTVDYGPVTPGRNTAAGRFEKGAAIALFWHVFTY